MTRTLGNRKQADTGDFVGRANEQQQFRATLRELERIRTVRDADLPENLPYAQIFLVAAEGGMGKTTLMRRFEAIATENNEKSDAKALYIDLEEYHKRTRIGSNIEQFGGGVNAFFSNFAINQATAAQFNHAPAQRRH